MTGSSLRAADVVDYKQPYGRAAGYQSPVGDGRFDFVIPIRDNIRSLKTPYVTYAIVASCVAVFIAQKLSPEAMALYMFVPRFLVSTEAWSALGWPHIALTSVTSMFMHGDIPHLLFNMLFLWVFGDNIEGRMGHLRYLLFYLLCGILALAAHALVSLFSPVPVVGASGAIAGILGAYFVLFRTATIRTLVIFFFITLIDLPAVLFIGIWFIFQLLSGLGTIGAVQGGVAFWAHIGGFLAGLWLVRYFTPQGRRGPPKPRVIEMRY